ncbi:Glutathione S-transferase theta-1 [Paramecium bursaria]
MSMIRFQRFNIYYMGSRNKPEYTQITAHTCIKNSDPSFKHNKNMIKILYFQFTYYIIKKMPLVLYYYPLSQPSRAVWQLLILGKVEFASKVINVMKDEERSEEYTKLIPTQAVPAITDGDDFTLFESHAILKYIVRTYNLHQFYPQDSKQQALVDAYLDWHHTGTRNITQFFYDFILGPYFMKRPAQENKEQRLQELEYYLSFIEKVFLGEGKFQFIQNQPTLSIADLSLINELLGLFGMNYDFNQRPILKKYVEQLLSVPEIRETNKDFFELLGYFKFTEYNDFIKYQNVKVFRGRLKIYQPLLVKILISYQGQNHVQSFLLCKRIMIIM